MKTPRAKDKLGEVQFFLGHLQEENRKVVKQCPEAFGYYLSAFLNATYSVVEILKREADKEYKSRCSQWRDKLSQDDRILWDDIEHGYIREQRRVELHGFGAKISSKEKAIPAELVPGVTVSSIPAFYLGEEHLKRTQELGLPPWTTAWFNIQEPHFDGKDEVLQVCLRSVALLERLLQEFNEL